MSWSRQGRFTKILEAFLRNDPNLSVFSYCLFYNSMLLFTMYDYLLGVISYGKARRHYG